MRSRRLLLTIEIQFYVNIFLTYLCSCFFHISVAVSFTMFHYSTASTIEFPLPIVLLYLHPLPPSHCSTISLLHSLNLGFCLPLYLSSIPLLYISPLYLFLYFYYIFPSSSLSYLVNSYFRGPRPKPTIPIQFGRVCTSCYHTPCET